MSKIINTASKCTVGSYMECRFAKNFNVLVIEGNPSQEELMEAFSKINDEFIDMSGIVDSAEFELANSIFYLDNRVKMIDMLIYIQEESLKRIGVPCFCAISRFKRWGHNLNWKKDIQDFWHQLEIVKSKEKKYAEELDMLLDQLIKVRQDRESLPELKQREEFIRMLNNIQKEYFKIDRDKTYIEEVAIMYNDLKKAIQLQNIRGNGKHN